jgi:protein gp37
VALLAAEANAGRDGEYAVGGKGMSRKTKIDWADSTWNPVTGCRHSCEYCYARKIAGRFGGCWRLDLQPDANWRGNVGDRKLMGDYARHSDGRLHVLDEPEIECAVFEPPSGYRGKAKPYPYYFDPTFHRYRLEEPKRWKKSRTIFVCSMADLFGDWVPDEWIAEVFMACEAAPQHRYLFLTKNPARLCKMASAYKIKRWNETHEGKNHPQTAEYAHTLVLPSHENWWFGSTLDNKNARRFQGDNHFHTFTSIEPITENMDVGIGSFGSDEWVIIGAETGNRKGKITPKREWVENIVEAAQITGMKVFMKESLRELMGNDFRQETPWEGK